MNSNEPVEVRSCPFCDEKGVVHGPEHPAEPSEDWAVGCRTFGCRGQWKDYSPVFLTRAEAIAAWNRRASLSSEPADAKLLRQCADWIDEAYGSGVRTDSFVHHLRVIAGKLDALSSSESSTDQRDAERWRDFLRSAYATVSEDGVVCIGTSLDAQDDMRDEFPEEMAALDNDTIDDPAALTRLFDSRPVPAGDPRSRASSESRRDTTNA